MANQFNPSFESLYEFKTPDWFLDAKFGIWSHWGPQSVPMFGDWYARHMYEQGTVQYNYHVRHYGHPSKFGYKDICALWKAENFDADALMEKYYKAGARYFCAQASHHDHFFNYDSDLNRMNSVKVGPHKDICGLWKAAADKYGMRFGLTEHLSASFNWWRSNKGADKKGPYAGVPYDGNDPAYRDFYHDNDDDEPLNVDGRHFWNTKNEKFRQYWLACIKEMIDKYEPDLLYTDGGIPFGNAFAPATNGYYHKAGEPEYQVGLEAISYLYNKSIAKNGENQAIYTQKDRRDEIYKVGVLDIERSQLPDILPHPWQTDTCIGSWFYDARATYKEPSYIVELLVDIIAKNGTLLLNIVQRPDGTIDDEANYILDELAKWFAVCGEAVYGTRPWRTSSEGETRAIIGDFREDKTTWTSSDYRFVQKDGALYAFLMQAADNRVAIIKSLTEAETVEKVTLLGYGEVPFVQSYGALTVKLPENMPLDFVNCLKLEGQNLTV